MGSIIAPFLRNKVCYSIYSYALFITFHAFLFSGDSSLLVLFLFNSVIRANEDLPPPPL